VAQLLAQPKEEEEEEEEEEEFTTEIEIKEFSFITIGSIDYDGNISSTSPFSFIDCDWPRILK